MHRLVLSIAVAGFVQAAVPTPRATCRSVGTDAQHTWRFDKPGERWQVTHWVGAQERNVAQLALPATTTVRLSATEVHVKGRTTNGGIDVSLTGTPQQAMLDVYVSYELEVNVDTSLTPKIDELNTDGPVGVRCEIAGTQDR